MSNQEVLNNKLTRWFIFLITTILSGFLSFLNLHEFIKVGLLNDIAGYPFGTESPSPWYYKTRKMYALAALVFGLLFMATTFLGLWAFMKGKSRQLIIALFSVIAFLIVQIIIGESE